jgi:HEAT repeat protein
MRVLSVAVAPVALAAAILLALVAAMMPEEARAEGQRKPAANLARAATRLPADTIKRLRNADSTQIKGALDEVRIAGKSGASAVPAIVDLLAHGLPADLTQAAIETLGDTESEAASDVLASYSRHRNVLVRRAAVQSLALTRGPSAVRALRISLSDPDPAVRSLSASSLGALRAKEAVADLFLALDHKVMEASGAIGLVCVGADCDKLAAKLGSLPFEVVISGLDRALFRPSIDVNDDVKLKIVARVRELGTGEANRFLRDAQRKSQKRGSPRVKQAIDQAVLATSASPGATREDPRSR